MTAAPFSAYSDVHTVLGCCAHARAHINNNVAGKFRCMGQATQREKNCARTMCATWLHICGLSNRVCTEKFVEVQTHRCNSR